MVHLDLRIGIFNDFNGELNGEHNGLLKKHSRPGGDRVANHTSQVLLYGDYIQWDMQIQGTSSLGRVFIEQLSITAVAQQGIANMDSTYTTVYEWSYDRRSHQEHL